MRLGLGMNTRVFRGQAGSLSGGSATPGHVRAHAGQTSRDRAVSAPPLPALPGPPLLTSASSDSRGSHAPSSHRKEAGFGRGLLFTSRAGQRRGTRSHLCQFVWPGRAFLPDLNRDACFITGRPARAPGTCPWACRPACSTRGSRLCRVVDTQVFFSGREAGLGVHSGRPHGLKRPSHYTPS